MNFAPAISPIGRCYRILLLAITIIWVAACHHGVPVKHPASSVPDYPGPPSAAANAIVIRALSLVGTPYRYGGNTPESGFDCSGLIHYVYRDVLGITLPRSSRELAQMHGPMLSRKNTAVGDLIFFGRNNHVHHVGIYVGEGRFIHAPNQGGTVRLNTLEETYWRNHYIGSKRVIQ